MAIKNLKLRKKSENLFAIILNISDRVLAQIQVLQTFEAAKGLDIVKILNFVVCKLENDQLITKLL